MSHRELPPLPDARPRVVQTGDSYVVAGFVCTNCQHPLEVEGPWCPLCQSDLDERSYGPMGTVWSSTVFRVPLQGRRPPWVLAWVDLDDGPRILAHVDGEAIRPCIGARVALIGLTDEGDPLVRQANGNRADGFDAS